MRHARTLLDAADWIDGRVTAGHQSARVKNNLQLPEDHPAARELGDMILAALQRNPLFMSAALPLRVFPPLFNRYEGGQSFGSHVDNAIRQVAGTHLRIRTDLSATIFLADPAEYDGGELLVEDTYGVHQVKLPAGHMILYPATSLHHVSPGHARRAHRVVLLDSKHGQDDGERTLLFDLDAAIQRVSAELPGASGCRAADLRLPQPSSPMGGPMKPLRTFIFWLHLAAGVAAGLVILVMSATGAVLAFKPQILNRIDRGVRFVEPTGSPRLSPSQLLAAARASRPDIQPASIVFDRDPVGVCRLSLGREGTIYVNPYTGAVLGEGSARAQRFFRSNEDWHRWLNVSGENRAAGAIGDRRVQPRLPRAGDHRHLFIWWPHKWLPQHVKAILFFKRTKTGRARDFNWHNVIGFWCAPVLIILTATGVVISYPWANRLVYQLAGSPLPAAREGGGRGGQQQAARGEGRGRGAQPKAREAAGQEAASGRAEGERPARRPRRCRTTSIGSGHAPSSTCRPGRPSPCACRIGRRRRCRLQ